MQLLMMCGSETQLSAKLKGAVQESKSPLDGVVVKYMANAANRKSISAGCVIISVEQCPVSAFLFLVVYWHCVGEEVGDAVLKAGRKRRFACMKALPVNKQLENNSHTHILRVSVVTSRFWYCGTTSSLHSKICSSWCVIRWICGYLSD